MDAVLGLFLLAAVAPVWLVAFVVYLLLIISCNSASKYMHR